MEISPLLSTSLLLLSYHHAVLFLKRPITEKLNSPACVRVWERRGEYCSPSHKSSCAHKGKYLCWATAWQPVACLFFSLMFLLCCSCFYNPSSPCLSAWDPPLPLSPFSCAFSVSTTPSSWIPSDSLNFPLHPLGIFHHQLNTGCVNLERILKWAKWTNGPGLHNIKHR